MINRAYFINKGALCRWIQIPLDVGVYHPPSSQQYLVDCSDRLRRTAPRSKSVRLVLEVRFEDWLDYYPTRLLDDPVSHCRNPQGPLAAIWLGNVYPQHRLGVFRSAAITSRNGATPCRSTSSRLTPSTPALPPLVFTSCQARHSTSGRCMRS